MRILFAGSPAIAIPCLNVLSDMEVEGRGAVLAGLLTNPDRARKHGYSEPSDLSAAALQLDVTRQAKGFPPIPQLKPEKLDERLREEVNALKPELLVSFAYGRIFGLKFLSLFPRGGINVHPSLLPKYRGATPIPAAILEREKETGICIQKLALEMDAGEIMIQENFPLSGSETTYSLSELVSEKAARLLEEVISGFEAKLAAARPQEGIPTFCSQLKKEDGIINWNKSAAEIDAQIRA